MTNDKRSLGEPYLQDQNVIFALVQYRAIYKQKYNAQWVVYVYNNFLQHYRQYIKTDCDTLIYSLELPKEEETKPREINDDIVLSKFPYIKELASNFASMLREKEEDAKSSVIDDNIKLEEYSSEIENYYESIHELDNIIFQFDVIMRDVLNFTITSHNKSQKPDNHQKKVDDEFADIPEERINTLNKYFIPDDSYNNSKDKHTILANIMCVTVIKGRNGVTPKILECLQQYFTPNENYSKDSLGNLTDVKYKAEILSQITNIKFETIYYNLRRKTAKFQKLL